MFNHKLGLIFLAIVTILLSGCAGQRKVEVSRGEALKSQAPIFTDVFLYEATKVGCEKTDPANTEGKKLVCTTQKLAEAAFVQHLISMGCEADGPEVEDFSCPVSKINQLAIALNYELKDWPSDEVQAFLKIEKAMDAQMERTDPRWVLFYSSHFQ